jgi:hypothetical protein
MSGKADPLEFVGREPDERLLEDDLGQLPESVGRPEPVPRSPARRRLVGLGATLTGVSLVGGIGLIVVGVAEAVANGFGPAAIVALVIGILLVVTHWGWVHVAEAGANSLEARHNRELLARRRRWLAGLEPYTRWEVMTSAGADGSITIFTLRHRPVRCGERGFTFVREIAAREVHSGEEPGAVVTERAELLRRRAAADTERERERFQIAHDAYQRALIEDADEQQRLAAVRAASEALSERINANLREPPLIE